MTTALTGARTARRFQTRHHPAGAICHHYEVWLITCDQFDDMLDRASHACEICRTPQAECYRGRLVIDHADAWRLRLQRSYVRGLLCGRCNSLMARFDGTKPWGVKRGAWGSNPELLARAEAYIANSWQMPDGSVRPRLASPIDLFAAWT